MLQSIFLTNKDSLLQNHSAVNFSAILFIYTGHFQHLSKVPKWTVQDSGQAHTLHLGVTFLSLLQRRTLTQPLFCWPSKCGLHFEDHRPFIFLTIRFRSCIFGRNIKGPGCILLRAQMRRLCSQWILLVSMLTSITWIRWCSRDFSTMK